MKPTFTYTAKSYSLLTKPGIIFGNLMTMTAGFALASTRGFQFGLFAITLIGLGLVIASGCVLNNWIDKEADRKMARTQHRPLVTGAISTRGALFFSLILGGLGLGTLFFYVNDLSTCLALMGLFIYVVLYSLSKYYTVHGTLIGSVAGAVPPLVGYTSIDGSMDVTAVVFFLVLVFWQMPHFFAIAIVQLKDYESASIPVLPLKKGMVRTKYEMLFYTCAYLITSLALGWVADLGLFYFVGCFALGLYWLRVCVSGFQAENDRVWARRMFLSSLFVILGLSMIIVLVVLVLPLVGYSTLK